MLECSACGEEFELDDYDDSTEEVDSSICPSCQAINDESGDDEDDELEDEDEDDECDDDECPCEEAETKETMKDVDNLKSNIVRECDCPVAMVRVPGSIRIGFEIIHKLDCKIWKEKTIMKKRTLEEIMKDVDNLESNIIREGGSVVAIVRPPDYVGMKLEIIHKPEDREWLVDVESVERYLNVRKEHVKCIEKALKYFKKIEPRLDQLRSEYNTRKAELDPDYNIEEEGF